MKLSKNFSLAELSKSQVAERMGLDNNPSQAEIENLEQELNKLNQKLEDNNYLYKNKEPEIIIHKEENKSAFGYDLDVKAEINGLEDIITAWKTCVSKVISMIALLDIDKEERETLLRIAHKVI